MRVTRNIFLDTSAIVQQNFDFSSPSLKRLEELAAVGEARLLTTAIVIREVESNMLKRLKEAATSLSRIQANHSILKNLTSDLAQTLFDSFDVARAHQELVAQFTQYRERTGMTTLSLDTASADDVFDSYFSARAPFDDLKKKSEFPDAFNMSILDNWCRQHHDEVYVVSSDPDLTRHCDQSDCLTHLTRPGDYVDLYSRESAAMRLVEDSTQEHIKDLETAIAAEFSNSGFYLDDQEGEVNDVEVSEVTIDDLSLLKVDDDIAKYEIAGQVSFKAEIEYDDLNTAIWDSEDKVSIPLHTIKSSVERTEEFVLTAEVELEDGRFSNVKAVSFGTRDFAITAVEDDYPYK